MTTYNTGAAVPSSDVKDLYDNAQVLDYFTTGPLDAYADRLGVERKSLAGMRSDFNAFLAASGFETPVLTYTDGTPLTVDRPTQLLERASAPGTLYGVKLPSTFPVILSGAWATDLPLLIVRTDSNFRDELAAPSGADLVGYGSGTVADELDTLQGPAGAERIGFGSGSVADKFDAIDAALVAGGSFAAVVGASTVTLNSSTAGTFGVSLVGNVTTLNLVGGAVGKDVKINVAFTQDATGGRVVTKPAGVRLPDGITEIAELGAGQITFCTFTKLNGADPWFYERRAVFSISALPTIASENATFNDEGASTAGWTTSNATAAVVGSYLRNTKVAGGSNSSLTKALTFTPSNSDYILYGKMRAHAGAIGTIWLLNGAKEVSIWLGSANASGIFTAGAVSICGTTGASTRNVVQVASGLSLDTTPVDFALQYDHKFSTLTCWFREADGRWKWKGRVACNWFSATDVQMLIATPSAAGTWIEFDHVTLARPNIALLSDSIGEGKTLFSPDPSLSLTNDESTWMRHANIYPGLRNNLVVNKGVGGNTSAQMLSRVTDVTNTGARVVFLQASSNDEVGGISQATRRTNIQSTINAQTAASQATVLLNGSHGTAAGSDNTPTQDLRDYMVTSWNTQLNTLTGVFAFIDIMQAVKDGSNFLSAAFAADGIHFNVAGHTAVGAFIKDKE